MLKTFEKLHQVLKERGRHEGGILLAAVMAAILLLSAGAVHASGEKASWERLPVDLKGDIRSGPLKKGSMSLSISQDRKVTGRVDCEYEEIIYGFGKFKYSFHGTLNSDLKGNSPPSGCIRLDLKGRAEYSATALKKQSAKLNVTKQGVDFDATINACNKPGLVTASFRVLGNVKTKPRLGNWEAPYKPGARSKTAAWKAKAMMNEPDGQLTPADEGSIAFEIQKPDGETAQGYTAELSLGGEAEKQGIFRFLDSEGKPVPGLTVKHDGSWPAGQAWRFKVKIRTAGVRNPFIFKKVIRLAGHDPDEGKPNPEPGVPLTDWIKLKVTGHQGGRGQVVFEKTVKVLDQKTGQTQTLTYPDFRKLAGTPTDFVKPANKAQELEYYSRGDFGWCQAGHELIRAAALRAARFGGDPKAAFPIPPGVARWQNAMDVPIEKQLLDPRDPANWAGPPLPESNAKTVLDNVLSFIHEGFRPKVAPGDLSPPVRIAKGIWVGYVTPGKKSQRLGVFICQEHAYTFGSLMRALGYHVRAINIFQYAPNWVMLSHWQDASSEVWLNGKWFYVGFWKEPFYDHWKHYTKSHRVYEVHTGVKRWRGKRSRFRLTEEAKPKDFYFSEYWAFTGYGDDEEFVKYHRPPFARAAYWFNTRLIYEFSSPWESADKAAEFIAGLVSLADGKRVGADGRVDPKVFREWLDNPGLPWPDHLILEARKSFYFPPGVSFAARQDDPGSMFVTNQVIGVHTPAISDRLGHRLLLTGIGDGTFEIRATYYDDKGNPVKLGACKGVIKKGQQLEIPGSAFSGAPPAGPADRSRPPRQEPPPNAEQEIKLFD